MHTIELNIQIEETVQSILKPSIALIISLFEIYLNICDYYYDFTNLT